MNEEDLIKRAVALGKSVTDSSLLDKSKYESILDQDVMKVKNLPQGNVPTSPDAKRITGVTQNISNNTKVPILSGNAFKDRIAALRGLGKGLTKGLPALGAITALGTGLMSPDASAGEIASNVISEIPSAIPGIGTAYDSIRPTESGPTRGSFDERLERGELTPEELELLKAQFEGR